MANFYFGHPPPPSSRRLAAHTTHAPPRLRAHVLGGPNISVPNVVTTSATGERTIHRSGGTVVNPQVTDLVDADSTRTNSQVLEGV